MRHDVIQIIFYQNMKKTQTVNIIIFYLTSNTQTEKASYSQNKSVLCNTPPFL